VSSTAHAQVELWSVPLMEATVGTVSRCSLHVAYAWDSSCVSEVVLCS
jgi:hypothetical protein